MRLYRVRKHYSHLLADYQKLLRRDTFRDTKGHTFFAAMAPRIILKSVTWHWH